MHSGRQGLPANMSMSMPGDGGSRIIWSRDRYKTMIPQSSSAHVSHAAFVADKTADVIGLPAYVVCGRPSGLPGRPLGLGSVNGLAPVIVSDGPSYKDDCLDRLPGCLYS